MAMLPTEDNLTNAATTNAQQKTYFASLRNFIADLLGTDSSDKAAARTALGAADDTAVVKLTGAQTKSGVLTLTDSPIVPTATTSTQAINKGQADKAYSILGASKNLIITNNSATPNSQLDIDADEIILKDASRNAYLASAVNITLDMAVSGVGGLRSGLTEVNSTWYYPYVGWNGSAVVGWLDNSATAPTVPSGVLYWSQQGAIYNDGSGNFIGIYQAANQVWCDSTLISSTLPTTAYNAVLLGTSNVPPTAKKVVLSTFFYAPNSSITRLNIGPKNSSALAVAPIFQTGSGSASGNTFTGIEIPILTPNTIYNRVSVANLTIYELYINGWKY